MVQGLENVLFSISAWIVLLPVIVSLLVYRQLDRGMRIIVFLVYFNCFIEILAYVIGHYLGRTNLPLLHVYTPLEFIFLTIFYSRIGARSIGNRTALWMISMFVIFSIGNSIWIQNIYTFNTYSRSLEALVFIIVSLLTFRQFLRELNQESLQQDPVFWVNAGFLIYFSGSLFLFILSNYILPMTRSANLHIWAFHSFLSIVLYCLISIGLWKAKKTSMHLSHSSSVQ